MIAPGRTGGLGTSRFGTGPPSGAADGATSGYALAALENAAPAETLAFCRRVTQGQLGGLGDEPRREDRRKADHAVAVILPRQVTRRRHPER